MKPFYRLLMRGNNCVGVAVGVDGTITLVSEISGRPESIETFVNSVPKTAETSDDWFYALNDLLPMTYKIGEAKAFGGDKPPGKNSEESAEILGRERIVVDSRSSKLATTRVTVSGKIENNDAPVAEPAGKLRGREEEDAAAAAAAAVAESEAPVEEAVAEPVVEEAPEPEPAAAPAEPSPEVVVVKADQSRLPLSIADDGAGLHENWFLLLEDWNGLAAIFAGNRGSYSVLARSATQLMSEQIAEAVPSQAANLEHWVTMLIRELPAGVWLRSFASVRSITEDEIETPLDSLRAVIGFYGTPSPDRDVEFFGNGEIDGSVTPEPDSSAVAEPSSTSRKKSAKSASEDAEADAETADATS